jgi:predicted O-methyltransferase YrrM
MPSLQSLKTSLLFRTRLVFAAIFVGGKKLPSFYGATDKDSRLGWANIFDFFPVLSRNHGKLSDACLKNCRTIESPLSTEPDAVGLLYQLCRMIAARHVIEVGTYKGACSLALAQAIQENGGGEIHCIDISNEYFGAIREEIARAFPLVKLICHHSSSLEAVAGGTLPQVADLIFLDADHSCEAAVADLEAYYPLLDKNGILAVHDSIMWDGVCLALKRFFNARNILTLATSGGSGISLIFGHGRKSDSILPGKTLKH